MQASYPSIQEIENQISHHKKYRSSLIEEALELSYREPRKEWLFRRAEKVARQILRLEESLNTHYAAHCEES